MKKPTTQFSKVTLTASLLFLIFFIAFQSNGYSNNIILTDTIGHNSYKGIVVDGSTNKPLTFASISVNETNISTVSNSKGEFILKVSKRFQNKSITVSFLGYTSKVISLSDLDKNDNVIKLETYIEELSEVNITMKDAPTLMREVFKRKNQNYFTNYTAMTAFYRETIKKRNTYVSLSEAVIHIDKQPYSIAKKDGLKLYKSRKSTDYNKLDTLALKQRGGPYNTIYMDVMKNPELLFTEDMFNNYKFTFDTSTKIDNRVVYVVNFKPKRTTENAMFTGKIYVDAQSLALISSQFELILTDKRKATEFFILKKPNNSTVTPIEAEYLVDFSEKNGKWYHSYSRIQLGFKVNWNKKIFNSIYYSTMELAITDWENRDSDTTIKNKDRLKQSVVMSDEASGFADPEFWGEYNLIEPEKPIESAIKKIQKQLKKVD